MPTATTDQLSEAIQSLKGTSQSALNSQSVEDFSAFEKYLNDVEGYVRELQQSMWADDARATVRRLEKGTELSDADREVIRTFLISDAEGYLAQENNFGDWVNELNRLVADLEKRVNTLDRVNIADMRGVLKDAIRLVPDIRNYFAEQTRVEKFNKAMNTFDKPARDMLCRLLTEQLRSTDR